MNFQKSMRNVAFASAVLLGILTLKEQHLFLQIAFGTCSMILTVIGLIYCFLVSQTRIPEMEEGTTTRETKVFLVKPDGTTEKCMVCRYHKDGKLKNVRIFRQIHLKKA